MKSLAMVLLCVMASVPALAGVEGYYRYPATNGQSVVFAAEGDLWEAPIAGGLAVRLTTDAGEEWFPEFSPDGKWLAFSAAFEGNTDIYVMPASGGEPTRLTFHPDPDLCVGWTPDSERVLFRSRRESGQSSETFLFAVPREGGFPEHVNIGICALADYSPDGRFVAFNRLSREFRNWKRYKGGTAQDIWIGDLQSNDFRKLTDFEGTDAFPMWHKGRVFYVSDRSGRMNIFSSRPDGSDIRQHTEHTEYDVRWPDMHDGRVVYMHAGGLWSLDVETGASREIPVTLPTDRLRTRTRFEDAGDTLEAFDISHDGSRLAIGSRGEIWTLPVKGGRTIALNETPGIRERQPVYSPDGTRIAAITDESGEQEIVILDAMGREERRILTSAGQGWVFDPVWSPDASLIAYADLTQTLHIVDVETGATTVVDDDNVWEITEYTFSPDSKWLAYTKPFGSWTWDQSIYLYSIEQGRSYPVTTRFSGDHSPEWDPKGRYLYFISGRVHDPLLCWRDFEHVSIETEVPCLIVLAQDGVPPFVSDEVREMYGPKDDDDSDDDDDSKDDGDDRDEIVEPIRIDLEGIEARCFQFPIDKGNYSALHAEDDTLYYASQPTDGLLYDDFGGGDERDRVTLHAFDLKESESKVFLDKIRGFAFSADGSTIAWLSEDSIKVASTDAPPTEPDETISPGDLRLAVVPGEEWEQIFWEAWRLQRDFYWASNMAGTDWDSVGAAYAKLLPRISTRNELNDLIGQMIAELGTSHTYVWGGDTEHGDSVGVGVLGATMRPAPEARAYRFERVLRPEAWETSVSAPLTMPYANVKSGDYLFAINGKDLRDTDNVYQRLANLAGKEVLLTVGSRADRSDARDIQIKTLASETDLRYRDWCRTKREYVDAQSSGRVGYFHLPDMGGEGLVEFIKGFYPQASKDALIIDCRYNGGGFVSQMIIDRLARRPWAYMQPRRGNADTYPSVVHAGPKAMLTNYFAGSDGDIGPESFKMLKLGPVIGTRSWGGVVGIRADKGFIDGGMSTQPEFAWWEPKRGWEMENSGVHPDIVIDMLPGDYAAGRDPQIDKALEYLMDQLEANPPAKPEAPPYPDKSLRVGDR